MEKNLNRLGVNDPMDLAFNRYELFLNFPPLESKTTSYDCKKDGGVETKTMDSILPLQSLIIRFKLNEEEKMINNLSFKCKYTGSIHVSDYPEGMGGGCYCSRAKSGGETTVNVNWTIMKIK